MSMGNYPVAIMTDIGQNPNMDYTRFTEWIRSLRDGGKTMTAMARETGVSYDTIRDLIRGKRVATNPVDTAKILKRYGKTMEDFGGEAETITPPGHPDLAEHIEEFRRLSKDKQAMIRAATKAALAQ